MKIIIVGAGNMGSVLAARLLEDRHEVALVARGKRLQELREHGLRMKKRYSTRIKKFRPEVYAELSPELEADAILVATQRQHIDALLPALERHPCPRICFLFNCSDIQPQWQQALGKRLVWGLPAAVGSTHAGVVEYLVLPRWLRPLQMTTFGPTAGGDARVARELVRIFDDCGVPSTFHPDMRSWLLTHTALMLPPMAMAAAMQRSGAQRAMSWRDALLVAGAQAEAFALTRALGARLTPTNMWLLARVPVGLVALGFWLLGRSGIYRASLREHVAHASGEVQAMYTGLRTEARRIAATTPNLDALCAGLVDGSDAGVTAAADAE